MQPSPGGAAARSVYRRLLRAARRVPVAYAARKTAENARGLFSLYAAPRYDSARAALLAGAAADAAALERVLALPRDVLLLLFRKNVNDAADITAASAAATGAAAAPSSSQR